MKLIHCIQVHAFSLYMNYYFLLLFPVWSHCYGNLKFPYTYNGKWKLAIISELHYIFDESFTEMFLEESCTNHMNFVRITDFDCLPLQQKG